MSRKTHRSAKVMPASRSVHSAVHHRRRRGIRHFRKAAPALISRKPHKTVNVADNVTRPWDWSIAGVWTAFVLLGISASMSIISVYLNLNFRLDMPYAPHVRAVYLVPLAVIFAGTLGALGPPLLESRIRLPVLRPSSMTIGLAALLTGLGVIALPLVLSGVVQCSEWIHAHFVISDWPLRLCQFALILPICILPMFGLAFTARLMFAGNFANGNCPLPAIRPALALFTGVVFGGLTTLMLSSRPALLLPASSLPLLVLTLITVKMPEPSSGRDQPGAILT